MLGRSRHGRLDDLKRTLFLPHHLEQADLYFADDCIRFIGPYFGPTMELLLIHYLAQEWGGILKACGIVTKDRGFFWENQGLAKARWRECRPKKMVLISSAKTGLFCENKVLSSRFTVRPGMVRLHLALLGKQY